MRITPAGAGKTLNRRIDRCYRQDHPRRCGENSRNQTTQRWGVGSPPQVRGKLHHSQSPNGLLGITPAGAGKTSTFCGISSITEDHPRRCGENSVLEHESITVRGSPPQVRGKLEIYPYRNKGCWITPAGAGKTYCELYNFQHSQDHPRRCGENQAISLRIIDSKGSPPQVRGKPYNI